MIIFPAIDLSEGKVVRLKRGELKKKTIFNLNPVNQAELFYSNGAKWIHIVDLDAAFSGKPQNSGVIRNIINNNKNINIQLGGGIRDLRAIESWLKIGVSRVVLGTAALNNISLAREACKYFPNKIAVSLDVKNNIVATEGWKKKATNSYKNLINEFSSMELSALIYTDISKDGILEGPNYKNVSDLLKVIKVPLIASGGVSSYNDLEKLSKTKVMGVIVGRAIYDGLIDTKKAFKQFS